MAAQASDLQAPKCQGKFEEHADCAAESKSSPQFSSHRSNESSGSQSPEILRSPSPPASTRTSSPTPFSASLNASYLSPTANSTTSSIPPFPIPVDMNKALQFEPVLNVVPAPLTLPVYPAPMPLTLASQNLVKSFADRQQYLQPQYLQLPNNVPMASLPQPVYIVNGVPSLLLPIPVAPPMQTPNLQPLYPNMLPTAFVAPQMPAQPMPRPAPTFNGPFWLSESQFSIKFKANRAKGNFFISKPNIQLMMKLCYDDFVDERVAFSYYKESVAMQINDGQVERIWVNAQGVEMMLLHIDLYFKNNPSDVMYLLAGRNDSNFSAKVGWAVYEFVSASTLQQRGISPKHLPRSSRLTKAFLEGLRCRPTPQVLSEQLIKNTDFKRLPAKTSMRNKCNQANCKCKKYKQRGSWQVCKCGHDRKCHGSVLPETRIGQEELKYCVDRSKADWWVIPVVVIKGKEQWIEWKKFVRVSGNCNWVAISLRYYRSNNQWRIECMEYDAGRIFNQHRLVGPVERGVDARIARQITTSLDIFYERYNH